MNERVPYGPGTYLSNGQNSKIQEAFTYRALSYTVFVIGLKNCETGTTECRQELQFIF